MKRDLIDILVIFNKSKRPIRLCIDFSHQQKCANVGCDTCPLFYEPEYLDSINNIKEVIDE